jgi:urease subunit gamma
VVKGESDLPFTKLFDFKNEDEAIFLNVIEIVKDKLARNLRLNVHESLLVYCAYLVNEIRLHKSGSEIKNNSSRILTRDNVLIGVPETLREITFNATVDNLPKMAIQFVEPIPSENYMLVDSVIGANNSEKL